MISQGIRGKSTRFTRIIIKNYSAEEPGIGSDYPKHFVTNVQLFFYTITGLPSYSPVLIGEWGEDFNLSGNSNVELTTPDTQRGWYAVISVNPGSE